MLIITCVLWCVCLCVCVCVCVCVISRSCHNYHFCQDKSFIVTNICHDKCVFVMTKVLSQQAYFCRDKRHVLSQQTHVCHDKISLSWQNYVCRNKYLSEQNIFVATGILLSWQKTCSVSQNFCCDKNDTCGSSCRQCVCVCVYEKGVGGGGGE